MFLTLAAAVVAAGQSFTCTPTHVWDGDGPIKESDQKPGEAAWQTYSASAIPWGEGWHTPKEMDEKDMEKVRRFIAEARRAAL